MGVPVLLISVFAAIYLSPRAAGQRGTLNCATVRCADPMCDRISGFEAVQNFGSCCKVCRLALTPGCEQVRCDSSFLCPEIGTEPVIDGKCCGKCMKLDPNCTAVLCSVPECRADHGLVIPEGRCCPECLRCESVSCSPAPESCEEGFEMVTEPGCCPECQRVDPCKTVACKELVCEEHKMLIFPKGECCPKCLPTEGCDHISCPPAPESCEEGFEMVTECRRIDPCKTVACEQLVCKEHEILIFSKGECCPKCLPAEEPDCSAVTCLQPECDIKGFGLVIPQGHYCPECQCCESVSCPPAPESCEQGFEMVTEPGCCPECQKVDPCKTVACEELVCEEHKMLIFSKGECCPKCLPAEPDCGAVTCLRPECDMKGFKLVMPQGQCCPECQHLCNLPAVAGPCRGSIPSFFFNSTSKKCEQFFYGGCQGNANRFPDLISCEAACAEEICHAMCSKQFCDNNLKALCYNPNAQGCSGPCKLTYCRACYYAENTLFTPDVNRCLPKSCRENIYYTKDNRCFYHWSFCIQMLHRKIFGPASEKINQNFKCHSPNCQ